MVILWRLRLGAWGLWLVPWARIRLMLEAWSSILGPNRAQCLLTRLSSNSSVDHLKKIFEVCNNTPGTMHWLPTQERKYLPLGSYPGNLTIRLSNAKNNTQPGQAWTHWSTVVDHDGDCPASKQDNQCKSCRRCWSRDVKHVTYTKH